MGRHDDPDPAPFYTSLGSAILRGLLALFLSFGLYAVLASIRDVGTPPPATTGLRSTDAGSAGEAPVDVFESAPTDRAPSPDGRSSSQIDERTPTASPAGSDQLADAPSPRATTVQVLDAGAGGRGTDEVVTRLKQLGYEVVAVNDATRAYDVTTVFYTDGQEAAAQALRVRDSRFSKLGPNRNLSKAVDLHVVAGSDWR